MKKHTTTILAILLTGTFLSTTQAQMIPSQNNLIPQEFGNLHIELPLILEPQPEDAAKILQTTNHKLSACRSYHKISNDLIVKIIESVYKPGKSYNPEAGIKSEMKIIMGIFSNSETPLFGNTKVNGFPAQIATTTGLSEGNPVTVKILSIQEGQTVWFIYVFASNADNQGLSAANTILNTVTISEGTSAESSSRTTQTKAQTPAFAHVPKPTRVQNAPTTSTASIKTNSTYRSSNEIPVAGITIGMSLEDALRTKAFTNAERFQYPTNYDGISAGHILKSIQAQGKPKLPRDVIGGFIRADNPGDTLYGLPMSEIIIRVTWNNTTQQYVVTQIDARLDSSVDKNVARPKIAEMITAELGPPKHGTYWEDNIGDLSLTNGVSITGKYFLKQLEDEFQAASSNYNETTSSPTKGIFDK